MDKEKFNKLEVLEQIEYINNKLQNSSTLTSICKELNIGRSTIRDRFKKFDYSYSKELNKYIYNVNSTNVLQGHLEHDNDINNSSKTTDMHQLNNGNNTDVKQVDVITNIISKSDEEVKENLLDIVNNYDVLKEIIELHRRNTSVIKKQIVIDIEDAESKLITLRVNSKELELFNKFCEVNKQYRKIDLISQALKEFRLNHS